MAEKTTAAAKTAAEPAARGGGRETPAPVICSTLLGLQQTHGNRAVGRLLGGALLQPKLRIGPPGDVYEREADHVADAIVRDGADVPFRVSAIGAGVQRACHCQDDDVLQRCRCQEPDDPALLQPKTAGGPARRVDGFEQRVGALRGSGRPLPGDLRAFFEPRFGHDFGSVRVHTGAGASQAADAVRARAFTVGNDVVFGGGEWSPETTAGRHLIAHELTHVVQQTPLVARRKPIVQRFSAEAGESTAFDAETLPAQQSAKATPDASLEPDADAPSPAAGPADRGSEEQASADRVPGAAVVVDDESTTVGTGQMKKREFLTRLRAAVLEAAEAALTDKSRLEEARPFIDSRIADYEEKDAKDLNRDLSRLIPDERPTTAEGYLAAIAQKVRTGVATWERTGEIPPEAAPFTDAGLGAGGLLASLGGLFFKARPGGPRNAESPHAVSAKLGVGRPLDGGIRSRMESAFGRSFAGVQVHNDATAAGLSSRFNARAFTIGRHVAFGAGEYRPGTIAGDALMAHELAHVAQQNGADALQPLASASSTYGALERDADMAAVGAVASLWGLRLPFPRLSLRATPRLTSGLRLQRCSRCSRCGSKDTTATVPSQLLDTPAPSTSCCSFDSFEKSDDTYQGDQDCDKKVKFTVGLKPGGDEKKCVMVNWVKGFAKEADGTYHVAQIFGNPVELNLPTQQIDSVDTDPVYGSKDGVRWRYNGSGTGSFWVTDSPGPNMWNDGSESNFNFKMCLYCIDDVSETSDVAGSGVSNPVKCIEWDYKAKYDSGTDKCSH